MEGIVYWLPKKRRETRLIDALTRTGWFILVVALIVEFLAQHNKDSADALIIAALTDRASQAELALAKIKEPRRLPELDVADRPQDQPKPILGPRCFLMFRLISLCRMILNR
jgi:hypothetical protein